MARDMTRGNIAGTLVAFSVPLIFSGLLQQLYNWADALIVGNFVGESSLAAVGATGSLSGLFIAVLMGFTVGVSILTAQAFGEGDARRIGRAATAFCAVLGGLSLAQAAAGMLAARPLLALLRTPPDILPQSAQYLSIILIGLPAMAVYNVYTAVLRGMGDSRTPLYAIAVSALCNVALDLWFVAGLRWGVAGAAAATVLAQVAMTVFLYLFARHKYPVLRLRIGRGMLGGDVVRQGLALSIPTAVQSGVRALGSLLLQNIMNAFGTQTVAAITTAYRIDTVVLLPVSNMGVGMTTFSAQNMAAGNRARARMGLRVGMLLAAGVSILVSLFVIPSGGMLMGLFGVTETAVDIGRRFFSAIAVFYPLFAVISALNGYLQGRGDVTFCGIVSIAALGLRIGLSYLLALRIGNMTIAWAEVFSWIFQLALCGGRVLQLHGRDRRAEGGAGRGMFNASDDETQSAGSGSDRDGFALGGDK